MPQAIPILVTLGASAAANALIITAFQAAAISVAASVVVAGTQKVMADRKAARMAGQKQVAKDAPAVLLRSASVPRKAVYGRAMVSGPIAFARSTGTNNSTLHLVIPLCEGEIDGVDEIYLNEKPLGALNGSGNPTGGDYAISTTNYGAVQAVVGGSGSWVTSVPAGVTIDSVVVESDNDERGSDLHYGPVGTSYSQSGTTVSGTVDGGVMSQWYGTSGLRVFVSYTQVITEAPFVTARVFTGTPTQAASSELQSAFPGVWTSAHQLRGIAYLHIALRRDPTVFPLGLPNIKALVRGKKVYDPRTGLTAFSSNWALCVADYLMTYCGAGLIDINTPMLSAAANKCDEAVLSAGRPAVPAYGVTALTRNSSTEPRFTMNGVVSLSESPLSVLTSMQEQAVGFISWSEGYYVIRAGSYETPVYTLTESDIAAPVRVTMRNKRAALYNAVRGTYTAAEQGYVTFDATAYKSSTYKAEDSGVELINEMSLPFCRTNSEAQRLFRATLELSRRQLVVEITCNIRRAIALQAGDTVALTLPRHGFSAKVFRVISWKWSSPATIDMTLREEDSGWSSWTAIDAAETPAPQQSTLPDPFTRPTVASITVTSGSAYARRRSDNVVVQGAKVEWPASTNPTVLNGGSFDVAYKPATASDWILAGTVAGSESSLLVEPLTTGMVYVFRVRAVTNIGVPGQYIFRSYLISGPSSAVSINGYLTNESHTVAANSSGVVTGGFGDAGGVYKVYLGTTDITTLCAFSVVSETGVDVSINASTGVYSVASMSAGIGTATLRATYGSATRDKVYSISKSIAGSNGIDGDDGTPGSPGTPAQLLTIVSTAQAITFDSTGALSPSSQTITFTAVLQSIAATPTWECIVYNDAGGWLGSVTMGGSGLVRTLTAAQFNAFGSTAAYATVRAYHSTFEDRMTVVAIYDGAEGIGSGNLVPNSQFLRGREGWDFNVGDPNGAISAGEMNMQNGYAGNDWMLQGSGGVFIVEDGLSWPWTRAANGVTDAYWNVTALAQAVVKPGERMEVSAYLKSIRCNTALTVALYDATGQYANEVQVAIKPNTGDWPLKTLAGFGVRAGGFLIVPDPSVCVAGRTPARAMVFMRKFGGDGTDRYSYSFGTMFYLGRAKPTQIDLSPWSDGPMYDVSTGLLVDNAATRVYEAENGAYGLPASAGFVFNVCQITFYAEAAGTVNCSASGSGFFDAGADKRFTMAIQSGGKRTLVEEYMVRSPNSGGFQRYYGTASPTCTFTVAKGEYVNVGLAFQRNNNAALGYEYAQFETARLRVELVKK